MVQNYRKELIRYIQQHPETLPEDVQIFMPTQFRQHEKYYIIKHPKYDQYKYYQRKPLEHMNNNAWPELPAVTHPTLPYSRHVDDYAYDPNEIQSQLNLFEKQCKEAKQEYDDKLNNMKIKINTCFNQIQPLMTCFSSTMQRQNEMIYVLQSPINECLNISRITTHALDLLMTKTGDQQYKRMIEQLTFISFDEYLSTINKMFSTYTPLIDDIMMKMIDATQKLILN